MRSAVRDEPFLWKCLHIDTHLGKKISDADLLCLTQKSPGSLQCLSLEGCPNITDQGLKAVLESNLQLSKVSMVWSSCKHFSLTWPLHVLQLNSFIYHTLLMNAVYISPYSWQSSVIISVYHFMWLCNPVKILHYSLKSIVLCFCLLWIHFQYFQL